MGADTAVLLAATVLAAVGQALVVITTRPRPRSAVEILWLVLPTAGLAVLLVAAWRSVA
ncbi:MAG: hypothetical protein GWN07_25725 [Actinobacteria bacterium]|nr:hypothetical protein [Actinomycetota bacterium]NIS33982.1 hypothetical protein [Actinomycetota bacterium]NIU68788.1 hypothetical protein [Actinomycetota bacterium]NIV88883.1 hypothetical protein [Actinomycetota bacterium]NIW30640.1 hypothetical protein [Actinomycetota bacterium]